MTPRGFLFSAAAPNPEGSHSICPHCWMVNPGPFRLCARCGADMRTLLQESGGMRRTAAIQSPMPVGASARLGPIQRAFICFFLVLTVLSYVAYLLPAALPADPARTPSPTGHTQ